jgi:putative transposase
MKKKRFVVEQIVAVLKEAEAGMPVADLIRRIGITEQTFYRWKKQYAGLESDQARQLKQLQEENERMKKIVAELSLDKAMLADVIKKNGESRGAAGHRGLPEDSLQRVGTTRLQSHWDCTACLQLQELQGSPNCVAAADERAGDDAHAIRLPQDWRAAQARRLFA